MRPLIYWARDHHATLRMGERTPDQVSGQAMIDARAVPFRFDLRTFRLILGEGEDQRSIQLNEYGWEI